MTATAKPRVLPADVYDTLELSALAFGGIGRGSYFDEDENSEPPVTPCCIHGHGMVAGRLNPPRPWEESQVNDALWTADIGVNTNDSIFQPDETRISFEEWCKRLNVVRGD